MNRSSVASGLFGPGSRIDRTAEPHCQLIGILTPRAGYLRSQCGSARGWKFGQQHSQGARQQRRVRRCCRVVGARLGRIVSLERCTRDHQGNFATRHVRVGSCGTRQLLKSTAIHRLVNFCEFARYGRFAVVTQQLRQIIQAISDAMRRFEQHQCARFVRKRCLLDVFLKRKSYMKDLMMTKEDVKKEYKESEGDPHHKQKRKELAHELMEGAQMESAKGADVIVTNPDHVAIAIKYDKDRDGAPRVIAKGIDARAESLREIARANDVPMLRNVPLAHALLRIDVNQEVPEELYDAVAEVLNFVYQLKNGPGAAASA